MIDYTLNNRYLKLNNLRYMYKIANMDNLYCLCYQYLDPFYTTRMNIYMCEIEDGKIKPHIYLTSKFVDGYAFNSNLFDDSFEIFILDGKMYLGSIKSLDKEKSLYEITYKENDKIVNYKINRGSLISRLHKNICGLHQSKITFSKDPFDENSYYITTPCGNFF